MKLLPEKTPEHRRRIRERREEWIEGFLFVFALTMGAVLMLFLWLSWI